MHMPEYLRQSGCFRGNPRTILRLYRMHVLEAIVALILMLLQLVMFFLFPATLWNPATVEVLVLTMFTLFPISATIVRLPVLVGMERFCRQLVQSFEQAEQRIDHAMMSLLYSQAGRDVRLLSGLLALWYGFTIVWESSTPPCRGMDMFDVDVLPCDILACSCTALCIVNAVLFSAWYLAPAMIRWNRDLFILQQHKGIPAEMIERLPSYEFSLSHGPDTTVECYICLENFAMGDCIRRMPCGHEFHSHCVDSWLSRAPSCPLRCRCNIWDSIEGRDGIGSVHGSVMAIDAPNSNAIEDPDIDSVGISAHIIPSTDAVAGETGNRVIWI